MTWIKELLSVVGGVIGLVSKEPSPEKQDANDVKFDRLEFKRMKKGVRDWYKAHYAGKWRKVLNKRLSEGYDYVNLWDEINNRLDN